MNFEEDEVNNQSSISSEKDSNTGCVDDRQKYDTKNSMNKEKGKQSDVDKSNRSSNHKEEKVKYITEVAISSINSKSKENIDTDDEECDAKRCHGGNEVEKIEDDRSAEPIGMKSGGDSAAKLKEKNRTPIDPPDFTEEKDNRIAQICPIDEVDTSSQSSINRSLVPIDVETGGGSNVKFEEEKVEIQSDDRDRNNYSIDVKEGLQDGNDQKKKGNEDVGNNKPATEEIPTQATYNRDNEMKSMVKKKYLIAIALCFVIITLAIVVPVVLIRDKSDSAMHATTSPAKFEEVVDFLLENGISKEEDLLFQGSPQNAAADWLANQDEMIQPVPNSTIETDAAYKYMYRYIMALNYFAMGGSEWSPSNINFLSAHDTCFWNIGNEDRGTYCTAQDYLPRRVRLYSTNLKGTIPTENGLLTTLSSFWVHGNDLTGTIPSELCNLINLYSLAVGNNNLVGGIPSCIGTNQPNFVEMQIHANTNLGGTIPPSICNAKNLSYIFMSHTGMEGSIPECLGLEQPLEIVYMHNNLLTGSIPASLSNVTSLTDLFLDDNMLSGNPIPLLNQLTNLRYLILENNALTGIIDSSFLTNHDYLTFVDASNNLFKSSEGIPSHLFTLPGLEVLDLSKNYLGGRLPTALSDDSNIRQLFLSDNFLDGSIPPTFIEQLQKLEYLDFTSNSFTGPMVEEIGQLTNLVYLFLADNPFDSGVVPETYASLTLLTELSLRNTKRVGELTDFIGSLMRLKLLDLGSNDLSSTIPSSYGKMTHLSYLFLNNNSGIFGEIPSTFDGLIDLSAAYLDGTGLSGNLDIMCSLPNFQEIGGEEIIFADCARPDPEVSCLCCICCPGNVEEGCSKPLIGNLEAAWETSFRREYNDTTSFGNVTNNF